MRSNVCCFVLKIVAYLVQLLIEIWWYLGGALTSCVFSTGSVFFLLLLEWFMLYFCINDIHVDIYVKFMCNSSYLSGWFLLYFLYHLNSSELFYLLCVYEGWLIGLQCWSVVWYFDDLWISKFMWIYGFMLYFVCCLIWVIYVIFVLKMDCSIGVVLRFQFEFHSGKEMSDHVEKAAIVSDHVEKHRAQSMCKSIF